MIAVEPAKSQNSQTCRQGQTAEFSFIGERGCRCYPMLQHGDKRHRIQVKRDRASEGEDGGGELQVGIGV